MGVDRTMTGEAAIIVKRRSDLWMDWQIGTFTYDCEDEFQSKLKQLEELWSRVKFEKKENQKL
jgi:hypothetical protein